jgi:hypothetical protein
VLGCVRAAAAPCLDHRLGGCERVSTHFRVIPATARPRLSIDTCDNRGLEQPKRCSLRRMPRKKPDLPEEVLAVLRVSPDLQPCSRFRKADVRQFAAHVNEGKCRLCLTVFRQWEMELRMMRFLRENRN